MSTTLLALALAICAAGDDVPTKSAATKEKKDTKEKPKRSPYAPSLPYLTKEEEDKLDEIIDRFMEYDIGRLRGEAARKALKDFQALGPEAIPALVRGVNRAAQIEHSCPVVVIAQKLGKLLTASDDQELMEFVRDEIGSGVGRTRHASVLQDLRMGVTLRKNALARRPPSVGPKAPRTMSLTELADAASTERGPRLRGILTELEKRRGKEVVSGLANAAGSYDKEIQKLGRDLLESHLARQGEKFVKERLADEDELVEVRTAAVRVVARRIPRLTGQLIDLLADAKDEVRAAAHEALIKLSHGQDFGPNADAGKEQIAETQAKWRSWWTGKPGR